MLVVPVVSMAPPKLSIQWVSNGTNFTTQTNYTYNNLSIGAASADRYIVVCVSGMDHGGFSDKITTCTVDGVSATNRSNNYQTNVNGSLYMIAKPTGTTANVVATVAGGFNIDAACVTLFAVRGPLVSQVPTSAVSNNSPSGATLTNSLTIPAGGVGIAVVSSQEQTSNRTPTWTNLTEAVTINLGLSGSFFDQSSVGYSATAGAATRTFTWSGTQNGSMNIVMAAWR